MIRSLLITLSIVGTKLAMAQSVGIGTNTPAPSARLEINSTNQGFLPPRLTDAQRNSITSPVTGLVIFNTTTNRLNVFVGSSWQEISSTIIYPTGSVFCSGNPTEVVDVVNPITGETWMDRNLGASRAAISSTDAEAYGDFYQWGRRADGHQCRNSNTIAVVSSIDQPAHGDFILNENSPNDWRVPSNPNLWQGLNGTNNPCPSGYRVPTDAELTAEFQSWTSRNAAGAFASPLKFTMGGLRYQSEGLVLDEGSRGVYWSSSVSSAGNISRNLSILPNDVYPPSGYASGRGFGHTVRCIKQTTKVFATVSALNCSGVINSGTLREGSATEGATITIPYTGGNGGVVLQRSRESTGVAGLIATVSYGNVANGDGTIVFAINGTPQSAGTASFLLSIGGKNCTITRTVEPRLPALASLSCNSGSSSGFLIQGNVTNTGATKSSISYTGGNGANYSEQSIASTGVSGLTATLAAGTLANGDGTLQLTISGTPQGSGTANFAINLGGQSCTLSRLVYAPDANVSCTGTPTTVVEVVNPATGKTWMDRNLGAVRAATGMNDTQAYGDLYQWGRRADGHQCRNSGTTTTQSNTDKPAYSEFILYYNGNYDWRDPQNDNLWQGVSGVNNPCPTGFRVPTDAEWREEQATWANKTNAGAFASPLKLPGAGYRNNIDGTVEGNGNYGRYWSSSGSISSYEMFFDSYGATVRYNVRASGLTVRCIKN
jgi:uncharacterized protein (TIGR02145 family)